MQSLQPGVADTYTLTVNGNDTTVSILMLTQPPGDVPPPSADSERGLRTFVTVDPAIGDPGVASTFTYTIRVENWSDELKTSTRSSTSFRPAWVEIIEFPDSIYTWPTARVEVMGVFEITATDGKRSIFAEVWLGASSHVISKLNFN